MPAAACAEPPTAVPPYQALNAYLDNLLEQACQASQAPWSASVSGRETVQALLDQALCEPVTVASSALVEPEERREAPQEQLSQDIVEAVASTPDHPILTEHAIEGQAINRPVACLAVALDGFHYALPLTGVRRVLPDTGRWVHLPGQPLWCLGRAIVGGTAVRVIDLTGAMNGCQKTDVSSHAAKISYLVLLKQPGLALPIDWLGEVIHVPHDAVARQTGQHCPVWCQGFIKQPLMTLLDLDGLSQHLGLSELLADCVGA